MTAEELIAAGYRLYWIEVGNTIPVLCKPDEADSLDGFDVDRWVEEDGNAADISSREMRAPTENDRECLPFTTADIDGDPPTIGELFDAQKAAT